MPSIIPHHSCFEPLMNGYTNGVKMGDIEPAYWCLYYLTVLPFIMGRSLDGVDEEFERANLQFEEAKCKSRGV